MDDVKFSKNSMYARNRIVVDGKIIMLTIPTASSCKNKPIKDVQICDDKWRQKHLKIIRQAYCKSANYSKFMPEIEKVYQVKWKWISELNHEILMMLKKLFTCRAEVKRASDYEFNGNKNTRLISYCKAFGADEYLFGSGGRKYADPEAFLKNGIQIRFQEFKCPNRNLSFLDYLFNFGDKL